MSSIVTKMRKIQKEKVSGAAKENTTAYSGLAVNFFM